MEKLSPRSDVVFRRLFDDEDDSRLLRSLLNAILALDVPIRSLTQMSPEPMGPDVEDKVIVMDLRAEDEQGRLFNVEMQLYPKPAYEARALYYWSRLFARQLRRAKPYSELRATIGVHLLGWCRPDPGLTYHQRYTLCDEHSGHTFSDLIEIHVIELPRFLAQGRPLTSPADSWLY